jgi:four helix bundle protein
LLIWQKSIFLSHKIYEITKKFPDDEKFGLISQIRRCAVSVPSNIAEGYGRMSNKSFSSFLKIALGSLYELETQLVISKNAGFYREEKDLKVLILEIKRMIYSLIKKIK